MRVLLLGATGNVGSRLLPALTAHKHQVTLFVRSPGKLTSEARSLASAIVTGSGGDSAAIKSAILDHECDAVINAAGLAAIFSNQCELPEIFKAVVEASVAAHEERGGAPIRCWLMSGFAILDSPRAGHLLVDYIPVFPVHRLNYEYIRSIPADKLSWSLFCANYLPPQRKAIDYKPQPGINADHLIASTDSPPAWHSTLKWVPLIGTYLNIISQISRYVTPLEDAADFIAQDLASSTNSNFIGKRVAMKLKPKAT